MRSNKDTVFALATPKFKSAIAVLRITGNKSFKVIKGLTKIKNNTKKPKLTQISDNKKNIIDEVLITFFKSPKSYTGEDLVEISCHGSVAIINKISQTLLDKGLRTAEPGEFTKRALLNNKMNMLQAESVNDLIGAETENQRKRAINNLSGGLEKYLNSILTKLSKLLADIEAIIDFSDEELPKKLLSKIKEQKRNIIKDLSKKLSSSRLSNHIHSGFKIMIIGKPNTGKSSFINFISDREISIVTNIPGTTTDLVSSNLEIGGDKYVFIDSAGIRKHKNKIEKIGIQKTLESSENSDLNLVFLERNETSLYKKIDKKIFIRSKYDINKTKTSNIHNISSKTGHGIKGLLKKIQKMVSNNYIELNTFSRERHIRSIEKALILLRNINFNSIDTASEDVRMCYKELQQINQTFEIEKILDIIFSDFCIGK